MVTCPAAASSDVFSRLREILREPAFLDALVEVCKRNLIAEIERLRQEPSAAAALGARRGTEPYAEGDARRLASLDEQIAGASGVTTTDIRKFYQQS